MLPVTRREHLLEVLARVPSANDPRGHYYREVVVVGWAGRSQPP